MEITEHLLQLSRQIEARLGEVGDLMDKVLGVNMRFGTRSIYHETANPEFIGYGTDPEAWALCGRIIDQRNQMQRLLHHLTCETEVLTGMVDDAIEKAGRLV